jgi:hypothetical protein
MPLDLSKYYTEDTSGAFSNTNKAVVNFSSLSDQIEKMSAMVAARVSAVKSKGSAISVADMFDLQAAMNKLSQISEGASAVIGGLNAACSAIARNIKG